MAKESPTRSPITLVACTLIAAIGLMGVYLVWLQWDRIWSPPTAAIIPETTRMGCVALIDNPVAGIRNRHVRTWAERIVGTKADYYLILDHGYLYVSNSPVAKEWRRTEPWHITENTAVRLAAEAVTHQATDLGRSLVIEKQDGIALYKEPVRHLSQYWRCEGL